MAVRVRRAGRDVGTFRAEFKVISRARWAEIAAGVPADQVEAAFLREALVGWREIVARNGDPLPFSARERLIADPDVRLALMLAFAELVRHVSGNRPPGGGLARAA